ncbi:MAG: pyridoxal phosphate-dependent aminotransferase [Candidatus Zixiibacteriota bacterium]|nr:MAG: pyridoxal phosphate-dependent aminotransferase [candidate division Zixibacteria bacterium]
MPSDTNPKLSRRAGMMPASPIRKLVPFADEAKKKGVKVYHLNIGQPDIATPKEFMNAIKNFDQKVLAYGHSQGSIEFREKLSEYYSRYNIELSPEEIVVTTGGSEAIIFAMIAVCEPGEEIIVPEPFYTNYNGFAVEAGVNLVPLTTYAETGFHLPGKKEIRSKITSKTRAIIFCSPNNPTGTVFTKRELETLGELAIEHNLFLLSDEVYREFIYEGTHTSVMSIPGIENRAILLDSISKRFSACGARIGCLASKNKEVVETALRFGQARLCPPSIEQHGAMAALSLKEDYFRNMADEYRRRRDAVYEALMKIPGTVCKKPSGAFYIMAKLPVDDIEAFSQWMLTDFQFEGETTMIAPGPGFYATPGRGKDEARLAYVLKVEDLKKAMKALAVGIEKYNSLR